MAESNPGGVRVREAHETEAAAIAQLYRDVYGLGYVHARFYEEREIRRMILDEDTLLLVAEEVATGRLVGSASVLFSMGAFSDLVGEFGRLVVHPDFRGRRIGTRLMQERILRVGDRLQVAFAEVRVCNPSSPRISQGAGFIPVGALPQKLIFADTREHAGLLVKYFGDALELRRNHPRIIPEAYHLAEIALSGAGLTPDAVVDEDAAPYPNGATFELEELSAHGYAALLRIERGRVRHREVYGPQRLHYGLFKLAASHSNYLIAREDDRIVGALGFTRDDHEHCVRVFEVIYSDERSIRVLFDTLIESCAAWHMMSVQVDVSAHAPRMQRTLLELDFLPCAYVPALAFDAVERVDVVKMYRLMEDLQELPFDAPEPTLSVGRYVLSRFSRHQVLPRLARAMDSLELVHGLNEEQTARLLGEFTTEAVEAGRELFDQGAPPDRMLLIVGGRAVVSVDGSPVGTVGPGESLGEVAFLSDTPHSASAIAQTDLELGSLTRERMDLLVRRRPDIGAVVFRNLARGLGQKLRRADQRAVTDVE